MAAASSDCFRLLLSRNEWAEVSVVDDDADRGAPLSSEFSRLGVWYCCCLSSRSLDREPDLSELSSEDANACWFCSGLGRPSGGIMMDLVGAAPRAKSAAVDGCVTGESCGVVMEEEPSIQLARLDLTMYFPPLPAGGLEYLGEKDEVDVDAAGGGERTDCGCWYMTELWGISLNSLPGLLL